MFWANLKEHSMREFLQDKFVVEHFMMSESFVSCSAVRAATGATFGLVLGGCAFWDLAEDKSIVNFLMMMSWLFCEGVGVECRQRSCSIVISGWLCFREVYGGQCYREFV